MELSDFISKTLIDIQLGVQDAQKKVKKQSLAGAINPVWENVESVSKDDLRSVTFDIAVVANESNSTGASGGVKVLGVTLDGAGGLTSEKQNVTRIKFEIPIVFPVHVLKYSDRSGG